MRLVVVVAVVVVLTLALVLDLAVLEADGDDFVLVRSHLRGVRMTFGLKKNIVSQLKRVKGSNLFKRKNVKRR